MGVLGRLAKERAAKLSVDECVNGKNSFKKLCTTAKLLRDEDKADTIILGCAGLSSHQSKLESTIGIPVIDPVQAAVSIAMHSVIRNSYKIQNFP